MPPVVIIGHFRYANAKLMGVGHDWLEENGDFSGFEGMTHAEAFHIVPDRGMGLFFFETKTRIYLLRQPSQQSSAVGKEAHRVQLPRDTSRTATRA